jgi:choice-of-anchor C domain-containing protein
MHRIAATFAMFAFAQFACAAPFQNGSFEAGFPITSPAPCFVTLPSGSTNLTGWTVVLGNIDWLAPSCGAQSATDGIASVDLVGDQAIGGIQQTFDTEPGYVYEVRFDLNGNFGGPPVIKPLTVTVAGVTHTFTFDTTGENAANAASFWSTQFFTFVATGDSETITFVSDTIGQGANAGAIIDNVRITSGSGLSPPSIVKAFGAATVPLGGSTSLSFTISNPNNVSLTDIGFTDTLPQGLVVSAPNGLTGSCGGGSIVAIAGAGDVSLTAATVGGGATCTFSVNVTGTSVGLKTNAVTVSDDGSTGNTSTASITVVPAPPTIAKSFAAATIPFNGSTTLSFAISNPNGVALNGVSFADTLPQGLVVATPNGLAGSCGANSNVVASAGSGSITLTGGTLGGDSSCSLSVNVTGTTSGPKTNTVTVTSTNGGTGNTSTARVTVDTPTAPPTIAKSFGAVTIEVNESTSLSFTIDNRNTSATLTGVGFTDRLPVGLRVSNPNGLAGSCGGGFIAAAAGSGVVSLTGATLAGGTSCAFSVNVIAIDTGTMDNTTGSVTSVEGGAGGTASASIGVGSPPPPPRCVAPTITSGPFPSGVVGVPYAFTVTATGDSPLTLSISGLPAGLAFNPTSGSVSGVPTAAATSTLTITASNGCQPSAVQAQTLTVVRSGSTLSISASPNPAYFGQAVIVIVRAAGGQLPAQGIVLLCAREASAFCPSPFDTVPPGTPASMIRVPLSAPLDASGQASFTLKGLSIDNYILKASYGGDAAHDGANAGPIDQFVIKGILFAPPKVSLVAPSRASSGAPLLVGVRVTPSAAAPMPTGTVRLYAGADLVGTAALDASGSTQFRFAAVPTGALSLRADYSGDALFPPASSPESMVTIAAANGTADIPALGPIGLALLALALAALGMRPLHRRARRY